MTAGTTSSTPLPRIGDILNYVFLFNAEAARGRDEGIKARPCLVIAVNPASMRVTVTPLTTKGDSYPDAIGVPQDVARKANLQFPTAVVVAETNSFRWLGYDVRPLVSTADFRIGRMPPGFTAKIMTAVVGSLDLSRD